jgi:tRNA-2-methylthio-N6-dimethylallyladenosine synthase
MRTVRYDDAFLYRFSPRDGTPATRLPADEAIPDAVAGERLERLIAVHRTIQGERNAAEVGRTVEVLVERRARSAGDMLGRTEGYKAVAFPGDERLVGRYLDVRLVATTGATFRGQRVEAGTVRGQVA